MTTELQRRSAEAVNPATGERFSLDRSNDDLVLALAEAQEIRHRVASFESLIGRELLERMDRAAEWTFHAGPYKVAGRSPQPPEEYDIDKLRVELTKLVDQGTISERAAKAAVKTEVTYKPVSKGLNALRKLGPVVVAALDACRKDVDPESFARNRRVRVSIKS